MAPAKQPGDPAAAKSAFWTNTNIEVYYFLYFSSIACIIPYLNVEFRRLGLTEGQIGVLEALRPWLSAPAGFAWAALADYFSLHRTLYLVLFLSGTLCRSLLAFGTTSFSWILAIMLTTEVLFGPSNIIADAVVVGSLEDSRDYGQLRAYGAIGWGLFALVGGSVISTWGIGVAWGMYGAGSALTLLVAAWYLPFETGAKSPQAPRGEASDGTLNEHKGKDAQLEMKPLTSATHHSQLLGDELTVELADAGAHDLVSQPSLPIPSVTEDHPGAQENAAEILFTVSAADQDDGDTEGSSSTLDRMNPIGVYGGQPSAVPDDSRYAMEEDSDLPLYEDYNDRAEQSNAAQKDDPPSFRDLLRLVCSLPVALFIMLVLVMGSAVGVIDSYLFMYLEDLGASETLMGLTLTFTCIAEVPVFFCSNAILRALGTDNTLHLVVAAFVLRLVAYSTLSAWPTPWLVLPVELLHGITFGCAWAAGTSKSAELAPDGLGTSMQGIFQGSYFGVGRGLGALVGGFLYNKLGGAWMYRYAVLWVLVGWALQTVLNRILTRAPREEPAQLIKGTLSDINASDAR